MVKYSLPWRLRNIFMKDLFRRLFSILRCVNGDTHLWCVSVLGGAVLLCISFFVEPAYRELNVSSEANDANIAMQKIIEYSSVLGSLSDIDSLEDSDVEQIAEAIPDSLTDVGFDDVGEFEEGELDEEQTEPAIQEIVSDDQAEVTVPVFDPVKFNIITSYTTEEIDALERLVQCEAGTEDLDGRKLVAQVVLNRIDTGIWGDDILSVIKSPGQFKPVSNGAYKVCDVDQTTKDAVVSALSGDDISKGAIYFQKSRATIWGNKQYLFRHGSHSFYK